MIKEKGVLTEVTDEDLKLLQDKSARFWEGVTIIGNNAFINCETLEKIELPKGITEIREYAFNDCSNLKEIKVPQSVKSIRNGAFNNCKSLERIELPDGIEEIRRNQEI